MTATHTLQPAPTKYRLHLEPDLDQFRFDGIITIGLKADSPVDRLILDAVDLEVTRCTLIAESGEREVTWQSDGGVLTVLLGDATEGEFETRIEYNGPISETMAGFYRSSYIVDGEKRYLGTTQFEERDARRAFPCYDRPGPKSVFDLEILAPEGHLAIANTSVSASETQSDGRTLFRFEPTPPMSTYLVFFAVGPFDVEVDDTWRIPIRVAVSPGKGADARASLEYSRKSIDFLEKTLGVPYPLSKLDSIGLSDFAYGAMENFGAISYREKLLLTYDGVTTRREVEQMMSTAAHEIAHMWFGDLVSPSDWRYVWLNEAFATFFGPVTTDHWYPEWRVLDRFAADGMGGAMGRDDHVHTVPIELDSDDIEIDASTAPIVYGKGACVLRMFHAFFGDDIFLTATRRFLEEYQFQSADTEQFLRSFGGAIDQRTDSNLTTDGLAASELIGAWIRTPGVPLVRVRRDGLVLHLTQERFSYLEEERGKTDSVWPLLITGMTGTDETSQFRILLAETEGQIELADGGSFVKLNRGRSGYYRVFYEDEQMWHELGGASARGELGALDRSNLLADLCAFVQAGLTTLEFYLDFVRVHFAQERDPVVVGTIAGGLTTLHGVRSDDGRIAAVGRELLSQHAAALLKDPSEAEPYGSVLMRDPVLAALLRFGDETVTQNLLARARAASAGKAVHPDIYPLAMQAGVAQDPSLVPGIMTEITSDATSDSRAVQLITALASATAPDVIDTILSFLIDSVPGRNRLSFIRPAAVNPAIYTRLWDWFVDNLDSMTGIHSYHLGSTVVLVVPTGGLGREDEVRNYLEVDLPKKAHVDRGVIDLALDRLEVNRRVRGS